MSQTALKPIENVFRMKRENMKLIHNLVLLIKIDLIVSLLTFIILKLVYSIYMYVCIYTCA